LRLFRFQFVGGAGEPDRAALESAGKPEELNLNVCVD